MTDKDELRALMKAVATEAVEEAVPATLLKLGMDTSDPIAAQEEMAAVREIAKHIGDPEYQADQLHLRRWRKAMESASNITLKTAIGIIITGLLGALWIGITSFFKP